MRYRIDCEQNLTASPDSLWAVWTDMRSFPMWDPREEEVRFTGPFAVGAMGFSKQRGNRPGSVFEIVSITPGTGYTNRVRLPGGSLSIEHVLSPLSDGRVRAVKSYIVEGPMALAFRFFFAKSIRAEAPDTFAALEHEAQRRGALS
jgi:hypothetical protein